MRGIKILLIILIISMFIAIFWNSFPIIRESVHYILNPTAGRLLDYNPSFGILVIAAVAMFFITLVQKFTTDQDALRQIKKEQKILSEEMKKYKNHPEKLLELQKKQLEFIPQTMDITMKPTMYTAIPMILLFRWFGDYFSTFETAPKIFWFMSWFWGFFVSMILMSIIFRKLLKVA